MVTLLHIIIKKLDFARVSGESVDSHFIESPVRIAVRSECWKEELDAQWCPSLVHSVVDHTVSKVLVLISVKSVFAQMWENESGAV